MAYCRTLGARSVRTATTVFWDVFAHTKADTTRNIMQVLQMLEIKLANIQLIWYSRLGMEDHSCPYSSRLPFCSQLYTMRDWFLSII